MGMMNQKVPQTRIIYNTRLQVSPQKFQSKLQMKQVFCKGLAAFNFKHNRSYAAVVAADSTSRGPMGSNDRKGLGLIPKKALSSDKWSKKAFHKP